MDFDPNKNYYDVLGVEEGASQDDIKKAFRKAAMQHHPDRGGDQEKFKEVNEANQVIGDEQKRQQYDAFRKGGGGFGGFGGGQFGGFGGGGVDLGDLFGDLFGGGSGFSSSSRRSGPTQGHDLQMVMNIDFEEAYLGAKKVVSYNRKIHCSNCGGKGVEKDSVRNSCNTCNGRGVVMQVQRTPFGSMQVQTTCPTCNGAGHTDSKPCGVCHGVGLEDKKESFEVKVPAGIRSGVMLKYSGKGSFGQKGGPAGSLFIKISVKVHSIFERSGDDLHVKKDISVFDAVLGNELEVEHPEGKIKVKIPKGLQVGDVIKVAGKGFERVTGWSKKGDMIIKPQIGLPKKLSKKQEKLWNDLKDMNK